MPRTIDQYGHCYTETFIGSREALIERIEDMRERGWDTDYVSEVSEETKHGVNVDGHVTMCDKPIIQHNFLVVYVAA